MAKLCEVCNINNATIPDRERQGRLINRLCQSCHVKRLQGDLVNILKKSNDNKKM
jgi:hypothetical protein